MIISRFVYFILRFAELIASVILLAFMANFYYRYNTYRLPPRPLDRLIYGVIWSVFTLLASLILLIPRTRNFLHYPIDLVLSVGLFALMGLLIDWSSNNISCDFDSFPGETDNYGNGLACTRWKAAEAFAGLAGFLFFASFVLGIFTYHKLKKETFAGLRERKEISNTNEKTSGKV